MSWANPYITKLLNSETVQFRPHGRSMEPLIMSGQLCTIRPYIIGHTALVQGNIVLCKVKGNAYLHLVKDFKGSGDKLMVKIGNNKGRVNGWTSERNIYGICVKVEP